MTAPQPAAANIDDYIRAAPPAVRPVLREIRRTIHRHAPDAEEVISYRMPAFRQHGILLYFAAFRDHIGIYPPIAGDTALTRALAPYTGPKGNLRFPLDRPFPYRLLERIVKLRVKQDRAKATARGARKK